MAEYQRPQCSVETRAAAGTRVPDEYPGNKLPG